MVRELPNINDGNSLKIDDRAGFKEFVLQANKDAVLYHFFPTEIEVKDDVFFTLYLRNKIFIIDTLLIDDVKDYIDIYLYGVKQPGDRYIVEEVENDIIVTFTEDITRLPKEVSASDFEIKGKIAEVV